MIKEAYVSFELAKLLKEKGFNEECFALYNPDGVLIQSGIRLNNIQVGRVKGSYSAPTHQMAMAWLREVHNIHISVYVFNRELPITDVPISYTCDIATKKLSSQQGHLRGVWQSYEQTVEAALKYSLENLI